MRTALYLVEPSGDHDYLENANRRAMRFLAAKRMLETCRRLYLHHEPLRAEDGGQLGLQRL